MQKVGTKSSCKLNDLALRRTGCREVFGESKGGWGEKVDKVKMIKNAVERSPSLFKI